MKIAVIGTGDVGKTLGSRWAQNGYEVIFGVREPNSEKTQTLLTAIGQNATITTINQAITLADIIVLALPYSAVADVLQAAGDLANKIIIDATNPLAPNLKLSVGFETSGAEQIAQLVNSAKVVKAFNTTGWNNMENPAYGDTSLTMFICGDDSEANKVVAQLVESVGFETCETGPLYHARYLEPMAMLWIDMAIRQGFGRDFGFKILNR